jgi:DNA-binding response OmpR family regulator
MDVSAKPRLLVVDDDRKLAALIREYLGPMGYEVELRHNGPDGLAEALATPYEAVILDVMMPGMDGFAVLRELRKKSDVPVLMLTALGDEADRIVRLEIGADDYLPKTFSSRELLARLRAVTRRTRQRPREEAPPRTGRRSASTLQGIPHRRAGWRAAGFDDPGIRHSHLALEIPRPRENPRAAHRGSLGAAFRCV